MGVWAGKDGDRQEGRMKSRMTSRMEIGERRESGMGTRDRY